MRPDLDTIGLQLAQVWATRGTCARRKVGCVLFDGDGYQIGAGYNGQPSKVPHCIERACPGAGFPSGTELSKCEAIHAEANALLHCPDHRAIYTVYTTVCPCTDCVKLIANTGARRIVFLEGYSHLEASRAMWARFRPERAGWVFLPDRRILLDPCDANGG